jgi:hypothetical protein
MTPQERKRLSEQLLANPLFDQILREIEQAETEALIYAQNEHDRITAQTRVQAARSFRSDLLTAASTPERKGAPV